ncbi:uncharacterized protein CBL_07636 [Carabus blaptoides fortunei]
MKIFIKIVQGDGCMIDIQDTATILDIKKQIQNDMKVPVSQQTLVLVGKTLIDDKPLTFYPTIKDGTKLNLVIKKPEALNVAMTRFLQKYYSEAQSKRICDEFMKDFEQKVGSLSLDDLERIATSYLNDESG